MNNRQGGRRRGRSGPRPQGMSGNSGGNARDNRQRGNAAQLLEKYKSMARDSQLAGDRVQTEYYLQFADHYFRVLSETRSRFDEQRRGRDDFEDDEDLDEESMEAEGEDRQEPRQDQRQDRRRERSDRPERVERAERADRPERPERNEGESEVRRERFAREDRQPQRPRRDRFNGQDREGQEDDAPRIALDTLPPAIGATEQAAPEGGDDQDEAPRPRRRTRRPRADEGDEIAPAA